MQTNAARNLARGAFAHAGQPAVVQHGRPTMNTMLD
jgi:hypothetical protein